MSSTTKGALQRVGYAMLWPILLAFPIALLAGGIELRIFIALETLWLFVALLLILGPDSIAEITLWKASIRRSAASAEKDAKAAQEAKEEAERIRNNLRELARLNIENTFVLNSLVAGLHRNRDGERQCHPAMTHVEQNLVKLTPLVSSDPHLVTAWQESMHQLLKQPFEACDK